MPDRPFAVPFRQRVHDQTDDGLVVRQARAAFPPDRRMARTPTALVRRDAGDHMAIAGKWHRGHASSACWPANRRFGRFLGATFGKTDRLTHESRYVSDWQRGITPPEDRGFANTRFSGKAARVIKAHGPGLAAFICTLPSRHRTWPARHRRPVPTGSRTSPTPMRAPVPRWSLSWAGRGPRGGGA